MIFSDHALLRFVQRVIGIKNEQLAIKFISENKYEVYYRLLKLINESEVLYERFSPTASAGESYNYLLNEDILIVISVNKNVVVTLYDITIDINEEMNLDKIRRYARKIKSNHDKFLKKTAKKNQNDKESRNLEYLIDYKEKEMDELKKQLQDSINISKDIVLETKELRHENRRMMEEIMYGFKKLKKH